MRKKEVLYAVIGGCVGAVLTMAAGLFSPLEAQNGAQDVEFGTITCTGIKIENSNSDSRTILIPGYVSMGSSGGLGVQILSNGKIGNLTLGGSVGKGVYITGGEDGGSISVMGENVDIGMEVNSRNGGRIHVSDGDGNPRAAVEVYEDGGAGRIGVYGNDGKEASMKIEAHGGRVDVYGKGNDTSRATLAVNEYGNGVINIWDKNGYRLSTLK